MGSGVKGQGVGTILNRQLPGLSFSIRGCRRSDAIQRDPVTHLSSNDGAVACAGEYRSCSAVEGLPAWSLLRSAGRDGSAHMRRHAWIRLG
jgi:hypothetical protein